MWFNVELIKSYMKYNRLSKSKFAKFCNISFVSLNKFLNKDSSLGMVPIIKMAHAIDVEVKQLVKKK